MAEAHAGRPFYRRSDTVASILFASMLLGFGGPMVVEGLLGPFGKAGGVMVALLLGAPLAAIAVTILIGDVWRDSSEEPLKWGAAHKALAALVVVAWAYAVLVRLSPV